MTWVIPRWLLGFDQLHERAIVEFSPVAQSGNNPEQVWKDCRKGRENMTEFVRKTWASDVIASVAEYLVMMFVAVMTGVSTLRLLGILP